MAKSPNAAFSRRDLLSASAGAWATSVPLAIAGTSAVAEDPSRSAPCGRTAVSNSAIAAQLIAHASALEEAEARKDPNAYANLLPADYTEIAPHFPMTLKGRETARRLQEFAKAAPQQVACGFIDRPEVKVFGDLALLLYISLRVMRDGMGRTDPACRRVTRVYARRGGPWELVHTHSSSFDYRSSY